MELFVARAAQLAESIPPAGPHRAFFAALSDFERMLTVALDYPADCFTAADLEALRALADLVVQHIEARVDARTDAASVQQQLVASIYRIGSEVEALYTAFARKAAGNPSRNAAAPAAVTPSR